MQTKMYGLKECVQQVAVMMQLVVLAVSLLLAHVARIVRLCMRNAMTNI